MRAALVKLDTQDVLTIFDDSLPQRLALGDTGKQVSPAQIGWEGEGFAIVRAIDAEVPAGKVIVGGDNWIFDGDMARNLVNFVDAPAPIEQTLPQKVDRLLADYGLTREDWIAEMGRATATR